MRFSPQLYRDGHGEIEFNPKPLDPKQKRSRYHVRCYEEPLYNPTMTNCLYRTQKNPDDVVITLALRTPLAKGFKGGLKDTQLDYLVYSLLKKVREKSNIDPQMVEDICLGNV